MNSRNQIIGTEGGHNQTKRPPEARHYSLSRRNRLKMQHTQETNLAKKKKTEKSPSLSPAERRAARVARKNSKIVQE